ncbi:MAG TPA: M28 family peptidase [Methylomirabilota bacterium]|nr:M28 family peptidase [Methylomirabilota bacterium]
MIRRRAALLVGLLLVFVDSIALGGAKSAIAPSAAELTSIVQTLTSGEMNGRRTGTNGGDRAAAQLATWLADAGLKPGGENGTFLQSFVLRPGRKLGPDCALELNGQRLASTEWMPHGGSRHGDATGQMLFLGYGMSEAGWDDWAGVDARGRVVIVLDGVPPQRRTHRASRLDKLIAARQHGAAALLIVADELPSLEATAASVDLVSATLTEAAANTALAPRTVDELRREIASAPGAMVLALPRAATVRVDLVREDVRAANVIGILPGTEPTLAGDAIVLGAHYDHLGAQGGEVFYGADDNASGTAVVVGLARAFAAASGAPRTLVFALFGAEEVGLVGSGHYVRQPAWPLERTAAMLNFDMVGRMHDGKLTIGGADSGDRLRRVVTDALAQVPGVTGDVRGAPFAPSDHARFYSAGLPVLFFHTGTHADYHRPSDTPDKLNADGMARVAAVGARVVEGLDGGARPAFVRIAPPTRGGERRAAGGGVLLGVAGDGDTRGDGVRLRHVMPGSAAERAGLRDGDVLVRVGDAPVNTFEELRSAIRARQPGDVVRLVYLRDGRDHETSATLERSQE